MGQFSQALFIVNPTSGRKKYTNLDKAIEQACAHAEIASTIVYTERAGHAVDLAQDSLNQNFDIVFAVGGDGTVNEVAKGLIHSKRVMGILPKGSGNGLARHLRIPQNPERALSLLTQGNVISMDTLSINQEVSVNVSGIGFDGHIANLFGKSGKRGLREYVSLAATEFRKFKNFSVTGTIDGNLVQSDAFILAIANSSQFGNNATISPAASVCDQLMDICLIKKVPLLQAIGFAGKMFTQRMHKSAFVKIINSKQATFSFPNDVPYHIDGEGRGTGRHFTVAMVPSSLKVLVPLGSQRN